MILFFVIVGVMVLLATALLVPALQRGRELSDGQRRRQNVAIARQHLEQLKERERSGLVDADEAEAERSEIELALLADTERGAADAAAVGRSGGRWAGIVVAAALPFAAGLLYLSLGQPAALAPVTRVADIPQDRAHTGSELERMVAALEERSAAAPEDPELLFMLGNTYMTMQRFDRAAETFGRLRGLVGDDPDVLVRQADALAMKKGGVLGGEPERLLLQALAQRPDHPVALWLAGIAAQRRGDNQTALGYWRRAEPLFADDPESGSELRRLIAQAESESGGAPKASPAVAPAAASEDAQQTADQGAVAVEVSLDASLAEEVSDGDTLFVLARAASGPPMPLAVVRRRADELPLTVKLDDSMAMMPQMRLSGFDEVVVVAKVSKSGQAASQSGDLVGQVDSVTPGQPQPVRVVISQKIE